MVRAGIRSALNRDKKSDWNQNVGFRRLIAQVTFLSAKLPPQGHN